MTDYIPEELLNEILRFLKPVNALAMRMEMNHGMRIGDLLSQRWDGGWEDVLRGEKVSVEYVEAKTGKRRVIYPLQWELGQLKKLRAKGSPWLFPGRDPKKHRTRQAVWKDLHEVAKLYRVDGKKLCRNIGTHTARKVYAVRLYNAAAMGDSPDPLAIVMKDLNHSDKTVTFLYAMADIISAAKHGDKM